MSCKRRPENIAFSVAITPDKKTKFENEDTRSVAVLAPFNPFPKVSFENVKLHTSVNREVYLVNPTENTVQVELTKLPDEARGYQWSATEFELPKESQAKLVITWTPLEYGSYHDNIKILNKKTKKLLSELKLSSSTEDPPKVSKRNQGVLPKKQNISSKKVLKKSSNTQKQSENKENELTFLSKSKKQTDSTVCIHNENVTIYESKKSLVNKTFTQVQENDLDYQHCSEKSDVVSTHNSNRIQLAPLTPRRSTYDVMEPVVSSRRSTYSLRNRHIKNIIDFEKEKKEFELLASPGIHNESIEMAASKLINRNIKVELSSVDETETGLGTAGCSATFTVQPSETYNVLNVPTSLTSVTFNVLETTAPSTTVPSNRPHAGNKLLKDKQNERFSLESIASSEKFYDSLEERPGLGSFERELGLEVNQNEASAGMRHSWVHWDEIYDIDKFSSFSRNPDVKKSSLKFDQRENEVLSGLLEHQQRNSELSFNREILTEQGQSSFNEFLKESPYKNITQRKKNDNLSSTSLLNCKRVFDTPENLMSPKSLNQTKDTLLQLDEDFGKFNFSIVSSSPVNQNALSNNLNRTFTPGKSIFIKTDCLMNNHMGNSVRNVHENFQSQDLSIGEGKYSGDVKINNIYPGRAAPAGVENYVSRNESSFSNEEVNLQTSKTQTNLSGESVLCHGVQTEQCSSNTHKHFEVLSNSKQDPIIWNISPPKNMKEEEDITGKTKEPSHLSKLSTPFRLTRAKSSLSDQMSKAVVSQLQIQRRLQGNTNCTVIEPSNRKNSAVINNQNNSEDVFLVPSTKMKRGSSAKTTKVSPPKIRKLSQDLKIKRLSTPSMPRKMPMCMTEERKKQKADVLRSLPRSATLVKKRTCLKIADWVPSVRKLVLTSVGSNSQEDISQSPVDLATPDPFLAATTLNPFAKGGLYFNQKWLKEQEVELIHWADRMLRPPNELELDRDQSERSTLHRLNALRATAFSILTSTEVATVLSKVKIAVDKNIISIRSDRQLHADLGLQDKIIGLLMSYNPLWLRLCLEAVYQCNIKLKCHSDEAGLREFIRRYVLNDDYLRQTYSHPTIPYLTLPEFEDEMKKFTVYKFLVLVYLLDLVKIRKVILHDPCLFTKNSKLKSTKEILIDFNKDFVAGAGDITRILRFKGYEVTHHQTYIDEFDFSLSSTKELRDGVRLTRLAENLVNDNSLCSKLRVPAVSNLQKKYNAEVAFTALKKAGYDLPEDVSPKDISDGHNEKTLSFLWHLRGIIQRQAVLIIITKWRETKQLRKDRKSFLKTKSSVIKIQRWYRKMKKAGMLSDEEVKKAHDARENFLRLKEIVVRLQRIFRRRKEERLFKRKLQAAAMIQNWYKNQKEVLKHRNNFKALRQAAITIQTAFKNYKSKKDGSVLIERVNFLKIKSFAILVQKRFRSIQIAKRQRQDFLAIKTAAIKIQRRFRASRQTKIQRKNFLTLKNATVSIQRRFKGLKLTKHQRQDFLLKKTAATIIQTRLRSHIQARRQREEFLKIKTATVTIQRKYRAFSLAKHLRQDFLEIKAATVLIQRAFRTKKEANKIREEYLAIQKATVVLQRKIRACILSKLQRNYFCEKKSATILIQRRFRANKLAKSQRKQFLAIKAATIAIQRKFRAKKQGNVERENFLTIKSATIIIQRRFRGYLLARHQSQDFFEKKMAAITVQRRFRANKQLKYHRERFVVMKAAAVSIQRKFRDFRLSKQQRQDFLTMKVAAITIQRRYRAWKLAKQKREEFMNIRTAVVKIQRKFRILQLTKHQRQHFLSTKNASIIVQRIFRANKKAKMQRNHFLTIKNAAVLIQSTFRAFRLTKHLRQDFLALKSATIKIQRRFKANKQAKSVREEFISVKTATLTIQRSFKAFLLAKQQRKDFLRMKNAVITIQRRYRANRQAKFQRKQFFAVKTATITIQRRFRDLLLVKQQRQDFIKMKMTVIKMQRRFRSNKQAKVLRGEFIGIKTAAVKIQRKFKAFQIAKQQRQDFLSMKTAAIKIQRIYRGFKLTKQIREAFIVTKTAVLKIQRRFRSFQLAKQQRRHFLSTKIAAITVQRIFRANRATQHHRKRFIDMKNAAVKIQRRFRTFLLVKRQRQDFLAIKAAAITIQRKFRANKLARSQREYFLAIRSAAAIIQKRYLAYLHAKHQRLAFLKKKTASLTIQSWFRAYKQAKIERERFLALKRATVTIQKRFRAILTVKHQRREFLSLKSATMTIQRHFRAKKLGKDQRKKYIRFRTAVISIQRKFKENQMKRVIFEESLVAMKTNAATQIQAAWRGYLVRKVVRVPQLLPKAKPVSLESSTDTRQPISTLGQRYFKDLSNHRKYSVAELQNVLFNIDKITVLSADQCEYFVSNGAVKILFEILDNSNRAFGVHTCVELILSILLNFYRAPNTAEVVWKETVKVNGIFQVFDLMMRFKTEKTSSVFCKACTVTWLFAQDPAKAQVMLATPKIQDIFKYIIKSMKKTEQSGSSGSKRSEQSRLCTKKPMSGTRKKLPAVRFNWGNYFDDLRAFDDKYFALASVMDKLGEFVKL